MVLKCNLFKLDLILNSITWICVRLSMQDLFIDFDLNTDSCNDPILGLNAPR